MLDFRKFKRSSRIKKYKDLHSDASDKIYGDLKDKKIPLSIETIKKNLRTIFENTNDIIYREILLDMDTHVLLVFIDGLIDKRILNENVIPPLMQNNWAPPAADQETTESILYALKNHLLHTCSLEETSDLWDSVASILSGNTVIYIDRIETALKIRIPGWDKRNIEEPVTQSVVRGPREGFTESIGTNTALIRRKIKNPLLRFEAFEIGDQTKTSVNLCYIKGTANEGILLEIRKRLHNIKTDVILESGYIEEFIEDAPYSIFPTVGNSEKPDIVAAKILEGRVAILCDGTPFVLTVPYLFMETLQAGEDYYGRWIFSFFARLTRFAALLITTATPAYYVALLNFSQDVIPFKLLLTMTASRDGIPFSTFQEALLMIATFELLREAGIRMPRPVGQAVNIVGALVVGDAAVRAGLVSIPMVVVIALTAISSFILPELTSTILIIRLFFLIAANIVGIFGIIIAGLILLIHMCQLKSFGIPYLAPIAPLETEDMKDSILRFPIWALFTKANSLHWKQDTSTPHKKQKSKRSRR